MNRIDTSNLPIPSEILKVWQNTVDLLAEITQVPSALIMRVHDTEIEVFCRSQTDNNPYSPGEREALNSGLYCEHVMQQQGELLVVDATKETAWQRNPDIKLGMISYCGLPVHWPDKTLFGTICILDNKANSYNDTYRELLALMRDSLESQLTIVYQQMKLQRLNQELKLRVKSRTKDIASLNYSLSQEIDKRKAAEQEIQYQRNHDIATGFLNYEALKKTVAEKLRSLSRYSSLIVVQVGFTNGRRLQARYGDQALSELLIAYRERIGTIDCIDSCTCRISPVDLVLLLEVDRADNFIDSFCHRLLELSHSEFEVHDENLHLHAYIGAAISEDGCRAEELIQRARNAMLSCKDAGQKYMLYSTQMSEQTQQVNQLECYLLQAVRNDELMLYFQPKVDLQTGKWMGAEALIRWSHPNLGVISNESLIQMAEQNGLIFEVGNFVLRAAIEQASEWYRRIKDFKVAVNVSSVQLKNQHFIEQLEHLLSTYRLPAHCLEVELTESCLISNELLAYHTLLKLKEMGVTLSLDDFGTGCATFSYLKKYPFGNIKIDKSFLQNILHSEEDRDIMHSIVLVAKKMSLTVTVEGIETLDQEMLVVSEGCDYAQGYLYGKPMSSQEFTNVFLQQVESLSTDIV